MKKFALLFCLLSALALTSCDPIEEFEPGKAYFTADNTIVLYYSGEYDKGDVTLELHALNPGTDERLSRSITSIAADESNSKLIIEYDEPIPDGFVTMIYVFIYDVYETAVTVQTIKAL